MQKQITSNTNLNMEPVPVSLYNNNNDSKAKMKSSTELLNNIQFTDKNKKITVND